MRKQNRTALPLLIASTASPRNPVALALRHRGGGSKAHDKPHKAQRRQQKMLLNRELASDGCTRAKNQKSPRSCRSGLFFWPCRMGGSAHCSPFPSGPVPLAAQRVHAHHRFIIRIPHVAVQFTRGMTAVLHVTRTAAGSSWDARIRTGAFCVQCVPRLAGVLPFQAAAHHHQGASRDPVASGAGVIYDVAGRQVGRIGNILRRFHAQEVVASMLSRPCLKSGPKSAGM